jgi:hypothetical protein
MNDETVYQLCKQAVSQVILNGCVAQFTIWINELLLFEFLKT